MCCTLDASDHEIFQLYILGKCQSDHLRYGLVCIHTNKSIKVHRVSPISDILVKSHSRLKQVKHIV